MGVRRNFSMGHRGPLFAKTLILGPLHEKVVSELMTRRNYGDETMLNTNYIVGYA